MISKDSVEEFLNRPRRSYAHLKRWSRGDVLTEIKDRGLPRDVFVTRPRLHQLVCYLIGLLERRWLFFLGMSAGKTKIVLDLLAAANAMRTDRLQALVFVPKLVHMGTWEAQVAQHSRHTFRAVDERSVPRKLQLLLESDADITVIDYQGFALATSKDHAEGGLMRDSKVVDALARKYKFFAFDEVHRCKNKGTLRFAIMRRLVKTAEYVYGMTGTPHGRNVEDLWAQFLLVDGGETLGETIGLFRQALFIEKKNYFGGRDYVFDKRNGALLRDIIRNRSITYRTSECVDLPPRIDIRRTFKLPAAQRREYEALREGRMVDGIRVPVDGVFHRMREITSGYVRKKINGVSVVQRFDQNPKLDLLEESLLEVDADAKFIVYYTYNPTGDLIAELMRRMRLKVLVLDGRTKDPRTIEHRLTHDDSIRGLLCNSDSGSEGLNAQRASVEVFYEPPVSPITREQATMRVLRDGQRADKVTIIDLVAEGTVDDRILEFTDEGRNLLGELMRGTGGAQAALFGRASGTRARRR